MDEIERREFEPVKKTPLIPQVKERPPSSLVKVKVKEEEWKAKSNENLKERKSPFRVINTQTCFIFLILSILLLVGIFYYLGVNDYFSPTLVDNSTCIMPDIPACPTCPVIPACPNQNVTILNNFTIPACPNCNCNSS